MAPDRRTFLEAVILVSTGGTALALGLPGASFLLTPVLRDEGRTWVELGEVSELVAPGMPIAVRFQYEGRKGYTVGKRSGLLWVVPDAAATDGLRVLGAVCPHKGCNVAWSAEEELFACPCHRGRFDSTGAVVSGPPKSGLPDVPFEVREGKLVPELAESLA